MDFVKISQDGDLPIGSSMPLEWNSNQNATIFKQENAIYNDICEMSGILSRH